MKAIRFFTAVMLILAMAVSFNSCSSDDDDNSDSGYISYKERIIGTWVSGSKSYEFFENGSGDYLIDNRIQGTFQYQVHETSVHISITLRTSQYGKVNYEWIGLYREDDDTFRIGGDTYTRQR